MGANIKFPKKLVIDASVILSFLLPDEGKPEISQLFKASNEGKIRLIVPRLFYFEVFNSLRSAIISKRIKENLAKKLIQEAQEFIISEREVSWQKTFALSLKHRLSFYDASYLSLAKQEKIPLYSLDKKLSKLGWANMSKY